MTAHDHRSWLGIAGSFALVLALGCGSEDSSGERAGGTAQPAAAAPAAQPTTGGGSAGAVEEAEKIFATRCFTCHGARGAGDGPGSAALTPRPRNFQEQAWQDSVSDQHIEQIILYGGTAVGRSPTMPPNPDLSSKPDVTAALVRKVRSLAAAQ